MKPLTAAPGIPATGFGIALGRRSFDAIQTQYALVPDSYTWLHEYNGEHPHPKHEEFDGVTWNGKSILDDGVNWYTGDHAGCACGSIVRFVEVGQ